MALPGGPAALPPGEARLSRQIPGVIPLAAGLEITPPTGRFGRDTSHPKA